jgi:hypothetical protein
MSISSSFPSISPSLTLDFAKSKSLDPRITFTRAQTGNIATYVGSDGLIKYAAPDEPRFDHKQTFRTNLITYSEDFNQWVKENLNTTTTWLDQEISPDGSQTADKLIPNTSLSLHRVRVTTVTINQDETVTASIFVKYGGTRYLNFGFGGSNNWENIVSFPTVIVDLLTGEFTYISMDIAPSIEAYPNGWYRVSFSAKKLTTGTTTFSVAVSQSATGSATHAGDNSSGIYVWGAQLEVGNTPTAYIATGPSAVTRTATESLGLLIEEQRANLFKYSEDYTQPEWFKGRVFITANATTAPDGTQTADLLTENNTSTGEHYLGQIGFNYTSGQSYTWSWYVKPNGRTNVYCKVYTNFNSTQAILNLDTGDVYHATTEQFDNTTYQKLTNGWYRVSFTKTATSTGEGNVLLGFGNSPTTYSYLGDNTSGMYYWGAQVEAGAFPTSYIPTVSGSSVARPVDFCSIAASQMSGWFNSDNFSMTIEAESSGSTPGVGRIIWGISDAGSFNNSIYLTLPETNNTVSLSTVTGGTGQGTIAFDTVFDKNTVYNLGFGVANADRVAVNGGAVTNSISSGTLASEYNQFNIGSGWSLGAARQGRATISKLTYYPKRLTNSQLQILTK